MFQSDFASYKSQKNNTEYRAFYQILEKKGDRYLLKYHSGDPDRSLEYGWEDRCLLDLLSYEDITQWYIRYKY